MLETNTIPSEKRLDYIDKSLNQKRSVKLKTCADVYGHWRAYKRTYKKAPQDGVEFQIDYIDTGLALDEATRSQAPIALALHGAPGSYHDFALLIHHLTQQKVRVIAPNFPEYVATVKTKVLFRHSADEKAAYLRDFLQAIQVNKIDLLVSHSSAIFPTLLILLNANNEAIARQKRNEQQLSSARADSASDNSKHSKTKVLQRQQNARHGGNEGDNKVEKNVIDKNTVGGSIGGASRKELNFCNRSGAGERKEDDESGVEEEGEAFEDASDVFDSNNNEKSVKKGKEMTPLGNNNNDHRQMKSEEKNTSDPETETETNEQQETKITKGQLVVALQNGAPSQPIPVVNNDVCKQAKTRRKKINRRTDVIVKFEQPIEIKAVALLNPAGHRLPKSMKPTWFKCGSVHVYQHKFGRSLFRKFGPAFLTVVGVPVRVDNMDNVMLSATVMRNSKCQRVSKQLEQLSEMKIPTLLVFSENDKLIEKEIFYEMTQFMKLDNRNFDIFNNDGDIELARSSMEDWIRVMVFKAGGHYAYSNYAKTVNQAVSELLEKVRNKTSINK